MNVAQETLGFRRQGLSPCLSLLMSAFALLIAPASLSRHLHSLRERSSTTPNDPCITLKHSKRRSNTARSTTRKVFERSLVSNAIQWIARDPQLRLSA